MREEEKMETKGYRLVVCPNCKTPKILNKKYRTSKCYRCKKTLEWDKLASYGEFETVEQASRGIMRYKGLHVFQYANQLQKNKSEI